ncbi:SEC-C metal-binding domain-containing protein [Oleiagrimonas sp. MCCC 1A03011]|uniref:SEC-C metal-binding domain-containing protein n=1 Tax=Oleiagrimonas sp. MCCC 1A03011 TaxID=1926883 RepID=UPI000DC45D0E|nr:SEC-C metal-binding domain-containing protein [Oleiagrimonas sp. MCCC 1A03011]RAP57896.1 hypothetical protein BTJ49_08510 [Oleiagrimonas sp. MCCC 1A03011]
MAASDLCWCHSGQPFGSCHQNREHAELPHQKAFEEAIKRLKLPRTCAHPDAPNGCGKIVDAHTIQKNGGLSVLAEDGHVTELLLDDGVLRQVPKGIGVASTFEGFCNAHDGTLFAPVESGPRPLDIAALFLLAFRALAYSRHRQALAHARVGLYRQLDAGCQLECQAHYQRTILSMQVGAELLAADLTAMKERLDQMYRSGNYAGFRAVGWLFSELLPLAYSGAFYPESDIRGTPLQRLGHGDAPFEMLCATLTPWNGKTLFTLAWTGQSDGPAERYVRSFEALADDQKANAAMHGGFEDQENLMLRPSWWNELPETSRGALEARRMAGTETGPDKIPGDLGSAQPVLSMAPVEATCRFSGVNPDSG